jgi:hypothetical protein
VIFLRVLRKSTQLKKGLHIAPENKWEKPYNLFPLKSRAFGPHWGYGKYSIT